MKFLLGGFFGVHTHTHIDIDIHIDVFLLSQVYFATKIPVWKQQPNFTDVYVPFPRGPEPIAFPFCFLHISQHAPGKRKRISPG